MASRRASLAPSVTYFIKMPEINQSWLLRALEIIFFILFLKKDLCFFWRRELFKKSAISVIFFKKKLGSYLSILAFEMTLRVNLG
jgi:hypothetical protein